RHGEARDLAACSSHVQLVDARRSRPELLGRLPNDPLRDLDGPRIVAERGRPGQIADAIGPEPDCVVDHEPALVPVDDAAEAREQVGDGGSYFGHAPIIRRTGIAGAIAPAPGS